MVIKELSATNRVEAIVMHHFQLCIDGKGETGRVAFSRYLSQLGHHTDALDFNLGVKREKQVSKRNLIEMIHNFTQ